MRWLRYVIVTAVFVAAAYCATHSLWKPGVIGLKYDWGFGIFDWHFTWQNAIAAWQDTFLGSTVFINTAWLAGVAMVGFGLLTTISVTLFFKLFLAGIIVCAAFGMYTLLRSRNIRPWIAVVAALCYALAPVLFIRMIVGFMFYIWAYALAPWWWRLWIKAGDVSNRAWIGTALSAAALYAFITMQQQYVVMMMLLMVIDLLIRKDATVSRRQQYWALGLTVAVTVFVQLPWLALAFRNGAAAAAATNVNGSSLALISSLPHSIWRTLIGADHHITFPIFDLLWANKWFVSGSFALTALAFYSIRSKRRDAAIALAVLGLVLPLALGPQIPTSDLFAWLYHHVPFSNLFREVYHWAGLTTLVTVFAAAVALEWIAKSRRGVAVAMVASVWVLGSIMPFTEGSFYNYLTPHEIPATYEQLAVTPEQSATSTYRTLFLPSLGFVTLDSDKTPGAMNTDVLAVSTGRSQVPFASSTLDLTNSATGLRNAMLASLYRVPGTPSSATGYLQALGVNEVIARPHVVSNFLYLFQIPKSEEAIKQRWFRTDFSTLLSLQQDLQRESANTPDIVSYTVRDATPVISLASHPVRGAADWSLLADPESDAVFYVEDMTAEQQVAVSDLPYTGQRQDYAATQLADASIMSQLSVDAAPDPEHGWSRGAAVWWRRAALASAREPYIFTTTDQPVTGPVLHAGVGELIAKVWEGAKSESITVTIDGEEKTISTARGDDGDWHWVTLGMWNLDAARAITITGKGETGIAQLLWVDPDQWDAALAAAPDTAASQPRSTTTDTFAFTKESPTKYSITGTLAAPKWMIVRLGYDNGWRLKVNDELLTPVPVDGYAMAYKLPAGSISGELSYPAETPYRIALIVVGLVWCGLVGASVWISWRARSAKASTAT